jgi:putative transposase
MSHSYANNHVHAIFSTKDRLNLIQPEFEKRLYPFIASIGIHHKIPLIAAGGMSNHAHILFLLPSTTSLASAISAFKSNSSRFLRELRPPFEWQEGYAAFGVSPSQLATVTAYIRNQHEHHQKMTFEQEFIAMLKKAGVPYDPKYVFG